jgi:putative toxin-antitoxin system antitoxin component (TIGR02293 family)
MKKTVEKPSSRIKQSSVVSYANHSFQDNYTLVEEAQAGVKADLFFEVAKISQFEIDEVEDLLNITSRTIRNYQKEKKTLSPLKGELLLKLIRLFKIGEEVFGSLPAFRAWVDKPAYGLDGVTPFSLLNTSEGINIVMDEVQRIAFGEFA